jgi:hypothetical protein
VKWRSKSPEDILGSLRQGAAKEEDSQEGSKRTGPSAGPRLPLLHAIVPRDLRDFVVGAGMTALAEALEQERASACGPRSEHRADRRTFRAGHTMGELVLGGRRVQVERPRARSVDGKEVTLPSWRAFASVREGRHRRSTPNVLFGARLRLRGRVTRVNA